MKIFEWNHQMAGETKAQLDSCPLSPSDTSSARIRLHLISSWPKRPHGNPQTTQAITMAVFSSPQTDSETLLLKTTPISLTEHQEVRLVPT